MWSRPPRIRAVSCCRGVADAGGIHLFGIQFYAHEIGLHVHVAVSHVAAVIDVNELLFGRYTSESLFLPLITSSRKLLTRTEVPGPCPAVRASGRM